MSIRFSRISAMTEDASALFLVGGCPTQQADLDGWTAFDSFTEELPADTVITIHIETFLYGDGEAFDATPEEIAYFYQRIEMRPDFIEKRTEKKEESEFILWLNK